MPPKFEDRGQLFWAEDGEKRKAITGVHVGGGRSEGSRNLGQEELHSVNTHRKLKDPEEGTRHRPNVRGPDGVNERVVRGDVKRNGGQI